MRQRLELLGARSLTYDEVGATRGELPPDADRQRRTRIVGTGETAFRRAASAVLSWQVHRRAGLRLQATHPVVVEGCDVVSRLGVGRLAVAFPCRVVWVEHGERRAGFAYGTLPGHPVRGEEAFVVTWDDDDLVRFTITAFSRPASRVTRALAPVVRLAQRRATDRYLRTLDERSQARR